MNSDAAEQVVRMSLSGVDITLRLAGAAAKNAAALLIAWAKKEKVHIGRTSLPKLLSSKDELHVISLTKEQFSQFQKLAKKKITYAPFLNTKNRDGKVDIIMSAKQRSFANHILSKVGYGTIEPGTGFRAEIMNSRDKQELSGMNFETHGGDSKKTILRRKAAQADPGNPHLAAPSAGRRARRRLKRSFRRISACSKDSRNSSPFPAIRTAHSRNPTEVRRADNDKPDPRKKEWAFFRDKDGKIAFNPKCNSCARECKQSFRAVLVRCPVFKYTREISHSNDIK